MFVDDIGKCRRVIGPFPQLCDPKAFAICGATSSALDLLTGGVAHLARGYAKQFDDGATGIEA
ncbi:MAG: hypothetical protein R3D01_11595 [Hyphomicrobiales bacterium]